VTTQWVRENGTWRCLHGENAMIEEADEGDYAACVLALRDYVNKNGFPGRGVRPLGGIDSAFIVPRWRSMHSAEPRARRDAALSLHLAGLAGGTPPRREGARFATNRADSATRRRLRGSA